MNFSILKVDKPNKLTSLSRSKINFLNKEEDISLFHFNKFDDDLYHVVFNILDEYQVSTRKLGQQHNHAYSSLVNLFFLADSHYVLIEYINKNFQEEVINELMRRTKVIIESPKLNNELLAILYYDFNGVIKKLNYTSKDEELLSVDYVNEKDFTEIVSENTVDDFTLLVENQFIKVSRTGRISVNNSNENYLVNFVKRILNAIE